MVKHNTTSELDFLLLEEVSDNAAETISGGLTADIGLELLDVYAPLDLAIGGVEKINQFTAAFGLGGLLPGPEAAVGTVTGLLQPLLGSLGGLLPPLGGS